MIKHKNIFVAVVILLTLVFSFDTAQGAWFSFKAKVKAGSPTSASLLANMWNGTMGAFTGGSQLYGGVDDYNNGSVAPSNRYAGSWTQCVSGNNYCDTGDSSTVYRDQSTGLAWSKTMNASTYALDNSNGSLTWFKANNCTETSGSACTKKTSSKTGCEANPGWFLPHQKQLIQAYIDGSYGNLDAQGVYRSYWSATTLSGDPLNAWGVDLSSGGTYYDSKTGAYKVHCIRE